MVRIEMTEIEINPATVIAIPIIAGILSNPGNRECACFTEIIDEIEKHPNENGSSEYTKRQRFIDGIVNVGFEIANKIIEKDESQ